VTPHRIWNPEFETLPRSGLRALQLERLQTVVRTVHEKCVLPRPVQTGGVGPADIRSLDDIRKLPFTTKADLQRAIPTDFFAVPMKDVVRIHSSSGTTGRRPSWVHPRRPRTLGGAHRPPAHRGGVTSRTSSRSRFGYGLFTADSACTTEPSGSAPR